MPDPVPLGICSGATVPSTNPTSLRPDSSIRSRTCATLPLGHRQVTQAQRVAVLQREQIDEQGAARQRDLAAIGHHRDHRAQRDEHARHLSRRRTDEANAQLTRRDERAGFTRAHQCSNREEAK
jgi:hypothetical protein